MNLLTKRAICLTPRSESDRFSAHSPQSIAAVFRYDCLHTHVCDNILARNKDTLRISLFIYKISPSHKNREINGYFPQIPRSYSFKLGTLFIQNFTMFQR